MDHFELVSEYAPTGDQPHAIEQLVEGFRQGNQFQTLLGVPRLHGAQVRATDLRGGAALAVAALGAEGRSELTGVHHIDRGYQSLEGDLRRLGAEIRRI